MGVGLGPSSIPAILPITTVIYTAAVTWKRKEPWCFLLFVSRRAQQLLTITAIVMIPPNKFDVTKLRCKPITIHP